MVDVSIEFRNNVDLSQQFHDYRVNTTLNMKYSDYEPRSRKNIQTWAKSVCHIILGADVTNLLNDVSRVEGVAKLYPFDKVSTLLHLIIS